jgi:hypothetical protein
MIWLHSVFCQKSRSNLDRRHTGGLKKREQADGSRRGGVGGAKYYDGEKAWSSVNHSILSGHEEKKSVSCAFPVVQIADIQFPYPACDDDYVHSIFSVTKAVSLLYLYHSVRPPMSEILAVNFPVVKFKVIDCGGIKLTPAKGCRSGPPGYIGWRAGTTSLCRPESTFSPSQGLRIWLQGRHRYGHM